MVKSRENLLGAWSFLIGVMLAVIVGLFQSQLASLSNIFYALLVLLGLVVGFMIQDDKDSMTFLIAGLALVIVSSMGNGTLVFLSNLSPILSSLNNILTTLLILFVPATIVVAIKTVFSITEI